MLTVKFPPNDRGHLNRPGKQSAIDRVIEQLDVFSVVLVADGLTTTYGMTTEAARYDALRRAHATQIVNAVEALLKDRE